MISFYLFIFATLLTPSLAAGSIKNEICEKRGAAKNIQELARKFEHLSLQQKRKIKEWSSEKTLEENLAAYNVTDLVKDMHLQQCVIVEIGEGFCSLFVETRNETGYSCNGTTSNTQELFLGICECSKIHAWRFCGSQLSTEHHNECTFKEATSKQENSARVHRRLCEITEMIKWNTCNCSHSINDQILLQTEGFPSCYRAPISQSVCYPRSVCGRSRCTPIALENNVRSMQCDPECSGGQPFCEEDVFPSSIASNVNSLWSDWEEPECNATSGEGSLISRATCLDKISGNCALDCFGPWKSCCPLSLSPCVCDVSLVEGTLVATRILGPCTSVTDNDEPEAPPSEPFEPLETCEDTTPRNATSPPAKPSGEEYDTAKRFGPELMRKMVESLSKSFKLIPGMSSVPRNARAKDQAKLGDHSKKDESSSKRLWKLHRAKRRESARKQRSKRLVSERKCPLRRLLQWQQRDGEYDNFGEMWKRECLTPPTKAETWEDGDEAELEIPEYEEEHQTESSVPATLVPEKQEAMNATKVTPLQAEIEDNDEEEADEDAGQEEQVSQGSGPESQEIQDDSDFDFHAISEEPATSGKNDKQKAVKAKAKVEAKEKASVMQKLMIEKKSGKGSRNHKTRLKEPEFFEEEEEEGDEDQVGKGKKKEISAEAMWKGETEVMSPEEQQMDDFGQPEYGEPDKALQPNTKSKAKPRQAKSTKLSKVHRVRQSELFRKQVVFQRKTLRRLLWWRKHGGKYDYVNEISLDGGAEILCKRDCLPPPTKPETWDDDDEVDLEILADGAKTETESSVQAVGKTEGIPVTDRLQASKAKKVTLPQAEIKDIDEEETEEDAGQEEQRSHGSDHDSQEIPGDGDFDFDAISEEPRTSERNDKNKAVNAKEKVSTTPKVLIEKKKSGKGRGQHKTRLKEPEVLEEGEEEGDEDPVGKGEQEEDARAREEAMSRGEFEETADEMDDDFGPPYEAPKEPERPATKTESKAESKASRRLNNVMVVASTVLSVLVRRP